MSLRYGRLFDATVREEYERALALAKAQLGPVLPAQRTPLPIAGVTGWKETPLIKSRLAGGYCLRTAAAEVAARSHVGRSTLYRRPELRALIEEHRQRGRDAFTLSGLAVQIDQFRTAVEALAAKVRRHEEQLRRLNR